VLITEETQRSIESAFAEMGSATADSILNRTPSPFLPNIVNSDNPLVDAYYMGKLAGAVGPSAVTLLTPSQAQSELFDRGLNNTTDIDRDTLTVLTAITSSRLLFRRDSWVQKVRKLLTRANQEWTSLIEQDSDTTRDKMIEVVKDDCKILLEEAQAEVDKFAQTELLLYFQRGQLRHQAPDTPVFKIPRASACKYCLSLHVKEDGTPITKTVAEISKSSNLDGKPWSWQMVAGPTHPYCYCILFTANVTPVPRPSRILAKARKAALARS